jgi:intradiol ring-cleaving dioxygenase-like protein
LTIDRALHSCVLEGRTEYARNFVIVRNELAPEIAAYVVDLPHLADKQRVCFLSALRRITDVDGKPIAGAMLDMWQADGEGLYEAQIDGAEGYMRGIYHSNPDGS